RPSSSPRISGCPTRKLAPNTSWDGWRSTRGPTRTRISTRRKRSSIDLARRRTWRTSRNPARCSKRRPEMLHPASVSLLVCPSCPGRISYRGTEQDGRMFDGYLGCARCEAAWPVVKGLAKLYDEGAFNTKERLMRFTYDRFGHYHDGLVRLVFPFLRSET